MPREYILYTVRGARESYYAAVDWDSGKVWTAPTKEVADRMAREAGMDTCTEEVISKDDLMRSLGFGRTMKLRPSDEPEKPRTALFTDHEPEPKETKPGTPEAWFVPANGQIELGAAERFPQLPRSSKDGKKSRRGGNKGSPFAADGPIIPGSGGDGESADDVLIVPSSEMPAAPKSAFSDEVPPVVGDEGE